MVFRFKKVWICAYSGFGMGLERVVAWICGISHIERQFHLLEL